VPTHGGDKCLVQGSAPISLFSFPGKKKEKRPRPVKERKRKGLVNRLVYGRHVSVGYATCVAGTAT
jgi:hypothetical protein